MEIYLFQTIIFSFSLWRSFFKRNNWKFNVLTVTNQIDNFFPFGKKKMYHSSFWDGKLSIVFLKNDLFLNPRCYGILKSEWEIPHNHFSCEIKGTKSKDEIVEISEELTCQNNAIVLGQIWAQMPRQGLGLWWGIAAQLPGKLVYCLPILKAPNLEGKQASSIFPQDCMAEKTPNL